MTKDEESRIIQAVLSGQTDRFEDLVREYEKNIYNLALRMLRDPQDALDASQEAFFRAYRNLAGFRGESRFSVWLYKLAGNVCLDMIRKRSHRSELPLLEEDGQELPLPSDEPDPHTLLERKETQKAVQQALGQLPPLFRQVLILREMEGLSYEEIAQITDMELGTVKSRIFRARKKLAEILYQDGNFSGSSASIRSKGKDPGKGGAER